MNPTTTNSAALRPLIAVVTPSTLSGIGLKCLLERIIPMAEVELFSNFDSFVATHVDRFFHFFVASSLFVEHNAFFLQRSHQSILLTEGVPQSSLRQLHWIDVTQAEEALVRDLLRLHQHAHRNGYPVELPKMTDTHSSSSRVSRDELTTREIDVLRSIVRGRLNKQIADELHIALTTVISHRRNLIAKLGIRSVSALTIYAVTKGYVDAEQLADER